ncbi:MAG: glycosyltransferase, partial [Aquisalimonadaceae bacterium]
GQTPAMAAGIDYASGEILVTMDGDLQNDPADIPFLIEQIHAGYDIVVGWRHKRQDKLISRKIPSRIANWLIGKVTGVPIRDNGCSLKAYRADVIKRIPLYSEMHRFIPAMASISGARVAQVRVRHHARRFGESKYGLSRVYKVLLDLISIKTLIAFAHRPLVWFSLLALPVLLLSAVTIGMSIYALAVTGSMPIALAGVGVLLGALAAFLVMGGILGELIYRTGNLDVGRMAMLTIGRDTVMERAGTVHDVERGGNE